MITVLCVAGTSEVNANTAPTPPIGLLALAGAKLDPERFIVKMVPYPAEYGRPNSYAVSRGWGIDKLVKMSQAEPGPVIWWGYSQGAAIVGEAARQYAYMPNAGVDLRGVGVVADPWRAPDQPSGVDDNYRHKGYGIAGGRYLPEGAGFPTWSITAASDPICDLPSGNPLRTIADATEFLSTSNPRAWIEDLLVKAKKQQYQQWWNLRNIASWGGALAYLKGYLLDGRHTIAYIREGHLDRLANATNGVRE